VTSHSLLSVLSGHLDEGVWGEAEFFDSIRTKLIELKSMKIMFGDHMIVLVGTFLEVGIHLLVQLELNSAE